ncbi:MAG: replicative DNA helicase [Alphaproteobacteria bacterium]|nr:replicative DNA helicase [Alphaproteobacteria bacterium]
MTADAVPFSGLPQNRAQGEAEYRVMPHNEEVEQALLGALLVNNKSLEKVSEYLRPEHFYNAVHGRIYEAIVKFVDRGQDASPITLKNYFEKDEDLAHVGGGQYLADLASHIISVVNVDDYGRTIYEMHLRRALVALGEDVVNDAYDHDVDVTASQQIEGAEKRLFDLATAGDFKGGFVTFRDSLTKAITQAQAAYQREGLITGVTTGLLDIDKKLGGLQKSDLLILAGRPSMGKTSLATNIAFNAARAYLESGGSEGAVVGFFSLEMSAEQLATRILADLTSVGSDKIRRGELKDTDFHKFVEASQQLSQAPLFIDDTAALTIGAIRTRARRMKRQHNLGMIVIDYLQLCHGSGGGRQENRVLEISEITRGLKSIAKELEIPVLALSQLSRAVEQRDNKRPQLSDLRESGSIEQDADVVMFVYREEYYLSRDEPGRGVSEAEDKFNERYTDWQQRLEETHNVAECIIAKQRHGPIGTVKLHFNGEFTRFTNLENYRVEEYE